MGLGYQQESIRNLFGSGSSGLNIPLPFINNLPYALVLQPISAGFTGLAAGAALLAMCSNSLLFTLAAFWAALLSIATLVIELIMFIKGRDTLRSQLSAANYVESTNVSFGPALWLQVAATAAVIVGFFFIALAWSMNRPTYDESRTYEAPLPTYQKQDDFYDYNTPQHNIGRGYDDFGPSQVYADPAPAPAPAPAPIASTGMGRAYDTSMPYDSALTPAPNRQSLVYDPAHAGSVPAKRSSRNIEDDRRHSRHSSSHHHGGHSRRHSSRSHARESRADLLPHKSSGDYDYEYDVPSRRKSREVRRRSHDPYLDVDQYEMDAAPRRSSRLYPQDDDTDFYAADPRRNSSGQRWKRYSDRGAF